MERTKITKIALVLLAVGGLGYIGYYLYNKNRLKSNDPQKNDRKIDVISTTK